MRLANLFLNSCWWNYLNLNRDSKIDYLSPIAGSIPGWYLWLKDKSGVYEILLASFSKRGAMEISSFVIKYYPDPQDGVFDCFSVAEQVVRLSDYFDNGHISPGVQADSCACSHLHQGKGGHSPKSKGFPKFQARKEINQSLFTIGEVKFYLQEDNPQILKTKLVSQDRIIEYSPQGITLEQNGRLIQIIEPGSIDRNVPAWALCWDIYEVLVKEVFSKMGIYPKNCQRQAKKGCIYYQEQGGDIWKQESDTVTHLTQTHLY